MSVRLFVGNMPYAATDADLRAHFAGVGEPTQVVIPLDRTTGRPRGFAFVEFADRAVAEEAINRFNQQPFMGRTLSVSEARPREDRGPRPGGPPPPRGPRHGGPPPGRFSSGPPRSGEGPPNRNFGPPKKKSTSSERRWEAKERGPRGPIKERFTGRLGTLYDDPNEVPEEPLEDFDDPARRVEPSEEAGEAADQGASGAAGQDAGSGTSGDDGDLDKE